MRSSIAHRLTLFLIFWLATLAQAQEVSPVMVETLKTTAPTTIRTGEPFSQTYKIMFVEAPKLSKRVVIFIDELKPQSFPVPLGEFDVVGWQLDDSSRYIIYGEDANVHTWYITYTLRIINPKKDVYVIPPIKIRWAVSEAGNVGDGRESETEEVPVNYVTTVTSETNLDIRDRVDLGNFTSRINIFWAISRLFIPGTILLAVFLFVGSHVARKKKALSIKRKAENETAHVQQNIGPISFRQAYQNFFKAIRLLNNAAISDINRFNHAVRDLLTVQLDLNPGDTVSDIRAKIEKKVKPGSYQDALLVLQDTLQDCQAANELNRAYSINNVELLKHSARSLKKSWRIWFRIRGIIRRK